MTVSTAHNVTTHWKEHGLALTVTAVLHLAALYGMTQVEMQKPVEPPKTQMIKLKMIQLSAPQTEPAQLPKAEPKPAVKEQATQQHSEQKLQPKPKQQEKVKEQARTQQPEKKILSSQSEQKVSKKQTADKSSTETSKLSKSQ
ncbi:hypothetical protein SAMN05421749_101165 [Acinetobacter marinus]|uniref:Protein TonB n=1 Tax=Acinetobacter marinus TaxID=281375 RepID=A0A1G6GMS0_9GAMM|nr:hypothetical protein [Acinetobacter marinus]SDB83133.1 hypothetical protein SAMN05421749_101165 [Acinetobacter marinus]